MQKRAICCEASQAKIGVSKGHLGGDELSFRKGMLYLYQKNGMGRGFPGRNDLGADPRVGAQKTRCHQISPGIDLWYIWGKVGSG